MPDTALAIAFAEAGYQDPWDELFAVAVDAWRKYPGEKNGGERRSLVIAFLRPDPAWALITRFLPGARAQLIGQLLNMAAEKIKSQRPRDAGQPAGGGQFSIVSQERAAPASNAGQPAGDRQSTSDAQDQSAVTPSSDTLGQVKCDPQLRSAESRSEPARGPAKPFAPSPAAPNLTVLADKQRAAAEATVRVLSRLCRLDTVTVDGKPIGDCTVAEVRLWADRRRNDQRAAGRDVRFALSLIGANLGSNEVIRKWVKPEEADTMYERAEAEYAA